MCVANAVILLEIVGRTSRKEKEKGRTKASRKGMTKGKTTVAAMGRQIQKVSAGGVARRDTTAKIVGSS
eukprot:4762351-Amphidinium_carterae.1